MAGVWHVLFSWIHPALHCIYKNASAAAISVKEHPLQSVYRFLITKLVREFAMFVKKSKGGRMPVPNTSNVGMSNERCQIRSLDIPTFDILGTALKHQLQRELELSRWGGCICNLADRLAIA